MNQPAMFEGDSGGTEPLVETVPDYGQWLELRPGLCWARLPLHAALDHVNVYCLESVDGWTLVDTGPNSAECRDLLASLLASLMGGNQRLRRVLVTHFHPDHIGLAGWLAEQGAELATTTTCWLSAKMLRVDAQRNAAEYTTRFFRQAGLSDLEITAAQQRRRHTYAELVAPLPDTYQRLRDGDRITIGARQWHVLCGYGHAIEHATLWSDDHCALVGDQILPNISANLSIHPSTPDMDPIGEWLDSCARFGRHADPLTIGLPGHNLPYRGITKRTQQLIAIQNQILERLLAHLSRPRTAADCLAAVYRRQLEPYERSLLISETMGYLNHLRHRGLVRRATMGATFVWSRQQPTGPHFRVPPPPPNFAAPPTIRDHRSRTE